MENMFYYEKFRSVPKEAQKEIQGGKLKGFTDVNPMWRIKRLTEEFGMCGIGWKAPIIEKYIDDGANGEKIINIKVGLQVKFDNEWSDVIEGIGGSKLITREKDGLTSNDEAYKMAYTDALSVACKMLGMCADIYYAKDRTKYDMEQDKPKQPKEKEQPLPRTAKETLYSLIVYSPVESQMIRDIIATDYEGRKSTTLTEEECAEILYKIDNLGDKGNE